MAKKPPTTQEIERALQIAREAVLAARATRKRWARRYQAQSRIIRLEIALEQCEEAAPALRSYVGRALWGGVSPDEEAAMKRALSALRDERRQLRRMLKHSSVTS